jgi:hypothetical protein
VHAQHGGQQRQQHDEQGQRRQRKQRDAGQVGRVGGLPGQWCRHGRGQRQPPGPDLVVDEGDQLAPPLLCLGA